MKDRFRCFAMVLVALLLQSGQGTGWTDDEGQRLSRHPYVQLTTPSSAVIVWRTLGETEPVVRYGKSPDALTEEVHHGVVRHPPLDEFVLPLLGEDEGGEPLLRLSQAPPGTFQYEWTLSGLDAASHYYYAVYHGGERLAGGDDSHFFRTSPPLASEEALRFWVVGDSGDGLALQRAAFAAIQRHVETSGRAIDAYLHLGDMAYNVGSDDEFARNFFQVYSPLLRHTVTWPTMGNHEGYTSDGVLGIGPYYDAYVMPTLGEAGGVASGTEGYYAFDYGPIHFVCLNSHDVSRAPDGEMAQWLREDLSRVTAKWLIAFFHHPPYSKGSHDSDREWQLVEMREHIMPILESHGVDLVLAGHSHTYERSMLIDGAYATPTVVEGVVYDDGDGDPLGHGAYRKQAGLHPNGGTVAVVAGHGRGGIQLYGFMPVMRTTVPEAGSLLLDVEGDRVTGTMINYLGQLRDRFQLIKSEEAEPPQRLDYPWRPYGPRVTTALLGSGEYKVVLTANPPAPDAVVRYTLDGSEVAEDSPLYEGPLFFSQDVFLRTQSTWRGGTRRSPETQAGWLRVREEHAVRVPIVAGNDDVSQIAGAIEAGEASLSFAGEENQVALRFRDLRLPPRVTIARAYLQFTSASSGTEGGQVWIQAERRPRSPTLTDLDHPLDGRPWTRGEVSWEVPSWFAGGLRGFSQRSPDLSDLIQELVEEPGWESGSDVTFRLRGDIAREVVTFEQDPRRSALLVIDYDPLPPLEAVVSQPPLVTRTTVGASIISRVYFRRLVGRAGDHLIYQPESSPDLSPNSWRPLDAAWKPVALPRLEGAWQFATFEYVGELETPIFLRLRVTSGEEAP